MNSSLLGKIDLNRIAQRYDCDESWLVGVPYSVVAARLMFAIHELVMQLGERYKGFIVRPLSMDHADTNDTDDPPTGLSGTMEPEQQFVTRDDFEQFRAWLSQQRTAEWTRLMEHSHAFDGKVVFPKDTVRLPCDFSYLRRKGGVK